MNRYLNRPNLYFFKENFFFSQKKLLCIKYLYLFKWIPKKCPSETSEACKMLFYGKIIIIIEKHQSNRFQWPANQQQSPSISGTNHIKLYKPCGWINISYGCEITSCSFIRHQPWIFIFLLRSAKRAWQGQLYGYGLWIGPHSAKMIDLKIHTKLANNI